VIRAVIDTNVLVSAMISSAGNEALLVMAINQGLIAALPFDGDSRGIRGRPPPSEVWL